MTRIARVFVRRWRLSAFAANANPATIVGMRTTWTLFVLTPLCVVALARSSASQHIVPASQPATTQLSPEEEARRERAALDEEVRQLPTRRIDSVKDVLRFKKQDERLRAECLVNGG